MLEGLRWSLLKGWRLHLILLLWKLGVIARLLSLLNRLLLLLW